MLNDPRKYAPEHLVNAIIGYLAEPQNDPNSTLELPYEICMFQACKEPYEALEDSLLREVAELRCRVMANPTKHAKPHLKRLVGFHPNSNTLALLEPLQIS